MRSNRRILTPHEERSTSGDGYGFECSSLVGLMPDHSESSPQHIEVGVIWDPVIIFTDIFGFFAELSSVVADSTSMSVTDADGVELSCRLAGHPRRVCSGRHT